MTKRFCAIRPARKADCLTVAKLYSISSVGVADYIWTRLAQEGEDIFDAGKRRYEQQDSSFSYNNCIVAELKNEVVGMIVSFPTLSSDLGEFLAEQEPLAQKEPEA